MRCPWTAWFIFKAQAGLDNAWMKLAVMKIQDTVFFDPKLIS